jgi:hypothetical protein
MATNNKIADISKLDYEDIREDLKTFLQGQEEFTDYDFDGSGIATLVDLLAYNTQYNAMLAHLNMNESFLDTAQVRSNVVSHAQLLGYVPRSMASAKTELDIVVAGTEDSPNAITIPRGHKFVGKINNKEYNFITLTPKVGIKLSSDNTYRFYNVPVAEGSIKNVKYRVDGVQGFSKYEIPSDIVDTKTLSVSVFENPDSSLYSSYPYYTSANEVGPNSKVHFLSENRFGRYDIYFGDGFLGYKPPSGSIISIEYIETSGIDGNNIRVLSSGQPIEGLTNISVTMSEGFASTYGGEMKESLESIRYNAPINFATQDRAVTANDYRVLLLQEFDDIQDVSIWGGEDNDPPIYGKVFIAPALKNQERATETYKEGIKTFLKTKNVGAITPELLDAEYTNIAIEAMVKYDLNRTSSTLGDIQNIVKQEIVKYNDEFLNRFDGILRCSNLASRIDSADLGIINTGFKLQMYKDFRPNPLVSDDYTLTFSNDIYISSTNEPTVTSSVFVLNGVECKLSDEPIEGSTENLRRLFVYSIDTGLPLKAYTDVGYIDPSRGKVHIKNIKFDLSNKIRITVKPDSFDIAPKYNQLVNINEADIMVTAEQDTVSVLGATGLSNYKTFKRH